MRRFQIIFNVSCNLYNGYENVGPLTGCRGTAATAVQGKSLERSEVLHISRGKICKSDAFLKQKDECNSYINGNVSVRPLQLSGVPTGGNGLTPSFVRPSLSKYFSIGILSSQRPAPSSRFSRHWMPSEELQKIAPSFKCLWQCKFQVTLFLGQRFGTFHFHLCYYLLQSLGHKK